MKESPARDALLGALSKAVKACEIVTCAATAKTRARRIVALLDKHGALDAYAIARAAEIDNETEGRAA